MVDQYLETTGQRDLVEYELTEHGKMLYTVIKELADWGVVDHKKIVGK
ncbi:winged helix-turn-helix transcriptional regulator [Xanthocytophaga agilis]